MLFPSILSRCTQSSRARGKGMSAQYCYVASAKAPCARLCREHAWLPDAQDARYNVWVEFGVRKSPSLPPLLYFNVHWERDGALHVVHARDVTVTALSDDHAMCSVRLVGRGGELSLCLSTSVEEFDLNAEFVSFAHAVARERGELLKDMAFDFNTR